MNTLNSRKIHLDIIRIISIILVIAHHTILYRYHALPNAGSNRPLYIGISFLIKTGVPMLYMISGALLLPKEESISQLLKRVFRYLTVLFLFSLISYIYSVFKNNSQISWWVFLSNLYGSAQTDSYWFLYQYLAYLISLPLLRKLVKVMELRDFYYLIIIWFLLKNSEFIAYLILGIPLKPSDSFTLFVMEHQVFFPLIGYFLEHRINGEIYTQKKAGTYIACIACISFIITAVIQNHYWSVSQNPDQEAFMNTLVFIPCIANYYLMKKLFQDKNLPRRLASIITWVSSCSFGVYLLQHIYLEETLLIGEFLRNNLGILCGTIAWVLFVFLIGTVVSSILKHIPLIKKLI